MNTSPIPAGYRAATAHDLAFLPRGSMWWCPKRKSWERSLKATATKGRIYCVPVEWKAEETTKGHSLGQNTPYNPFKILKSVETAESALERLKRARERLTEAEDELQKALDAYIATQDLGL